MRSLLIITFAFAFLAAYLEAMTNSSPAYESAAISHKVIRASQPTATSATTKQTTKYLQPLNLSIPLQTSYQQQIDEHRASAINWFKPKQEPEITYNAELVFDAEKGENITGGKVNIKIPLS